MTEDSLRLSKVPKELRPRLLLDPIEERFVLRIDKDVIPFCAICGAEIEEEVYYCTEERIFMHKYCMIKNHKINKNVSILSCFMSSYEELHFDRKVKIEKEL